tara:strand:- start:705 stop:1130 length:426 start_codon:yes stop_codon:yes gene_type:complete
MIELISLAAGAAMRFIFQMMAVNQKNKQEQFSRLTQQHNMKQEAIAAARKDESHGSAIVRRMIVSVMLGIMVIAVVGGALLDVPVYVPQIIDDTWSFLFFSGGKKQVEWITLAGGIVYVEEVRMFASAVIGYYLGGAVFKE